MHIVPLQYDLPWFLWHQLSPSFSFTLKILGLKSGIFLLCSLQGCSVVFSSDCDAFRTAPVWWTLIFMALPDFSSVKKKCCFSGGHLFWLPVAFMIQSKCSFECDAYRTAPVRRTMFFYDINWDLAFLSRWRFWVCKVVFFAFFHARLLNLFSSECDAIRIIRDHCFQFVCWVLVLLSVWQVGFFGRHFYLLLASSTIWLKLLLIAMHFVPPQSDELWFWWHWLSSSSSFMLKFCGLENNVLASTMQDSLSSVFLRM